MPLGPLRVLHRAAEALAELRARSVHSDRDIDAVVDEKFGVVSIAKLTYSLGELEEILAA